MSNFNSADLNQYQLQQIASQVSTSIEPLSIEEGLNRFVDYKRRTDTTESTLDNYAKRLNRFIDFCRRHNIDGSQDINGRIVDDYISWRQFESSDEVDELSTKTMRDELYLLRDFLSYLGDIEAVPPQLSEKIDIPELPPDEIGRDVEMDPERVEIVLNYLRKYEYATLEHVAWVLAARVGRRLGGYHSLDLGDAHLDQEDPYLVFRHRPPTPLKNNEDSEGPVAIDESVAEVLRDYIENNRPDVTDENGRQPLLATRYGRLSKSTFRRYIYKYSRPCTVGQSCPYDRDPSECEATQSLDHASKCPSSRSPHALRHGYISQGRRNGVPIDVLSDRCDVTEEVIRKYYDESTREERLQVRREIIDDARDATGGGYL